LTVDTGGGYEMKIYEHQGILLNQTCKNSRKNISEKSDFQAVMDRITSSSADKQNSIPSDIAIPYLNIPGIVIKEDALSSKETALNDLKDTLNLVDFYAEKLADQSLSTESLSPLVEKLEERLGI
jgi:uncharacterized protein (DUF2342 family)